MASPGRKKWSPEVSDGTTRQDPSRTTKTNSAPRRTKPSAYHRYFSSQKKSLGNMTPSYNVGRTRRAA